MLCGGNCSVLVSLLHCLRDGSLLPLLTSHMGVMGGYETYSPQASPVTLAQQVLHVLGMAQAFPSDTH